MLDYKKVNRPYDFVMIERDGLLPPMLPSTMPKVAGIGRKKGSGCNLALLKRMKIGDVAYPFSRSKMLSIRTSAYDYKIKLQIRELPFTDKQYIIKRLT